MDPLNKLFLINERVLETGNLTEALRAELAAAVTALRQQRAMTLAGSEAKVTKHNRGECIAAGTVDSYRPVEVIIGDCKIRISDYQSGDPIADRLAACWNVCIGMATEELLPGHYKYLRRAADKKK